MKLTKFSKDKHISIGTDLLAMDEQIAALVVQLSSGYGKSSVERQQADKMRRALLLLRSELENRYCKENPFDHFGTHVYFGSAESRSHAGIIAKTTTKE